ncbi:putative atp-dependent rna helicase drs1 [Diaporthe ampelina]|uniref:RNA helicase n=1 Tax=Diaporthe ampelina TaxID=1214573 RepID=A0A0G2H9W3_9PEZI|nr:putative atp-dependent rna helicase drs1 [Diaporthe ampelina]
MAPSKRKAEDDFILTISDNEDIPDQEAPPPQKKAKKPTRSSNKPTNANANASTDADTDGAGGNDGDDGAMDPDFVFDLDDEPKYEADDIEEWTFDGAAKSVTARPKQVLESIIRRRTSKNQGKLEGDDTQEAVASVENSEDDLIGSGDDEEVLAEDAFGMNVGSDVHESEDEIAMHNLEGEDGQDDDDDAASDGDSVATPVEHPDDDGEGSDSDDDDDNEDSEERAKRDAFFAPEEKVRPGKKDTAGPFTAMSLSRPILRGLAAVGFSSPTPIQSKAIPIALMGKDLVGGAATGSGKTAAFIVPILERLLYRPKKVPTTRVVVLTPTRELAIQCHAVATRLASYTDITFCLAVGGLSLKVQEAELRHRPDVVIATPGRFIDHMRNSASFTVEGVEILVLDEADRMLEDGFANELNEILQEIPKSRQSMLFSATMNSSVDNLIRLGMNKPARIMVDSQKTTVNTLVQEFVRLRSNEHLRFGYLLHICNKLYTNRAIVFFSRKQDAHHARVILGLLGLSARELHGNLNQTERVANIEAFRTGEVAFLLATNLASRGLDIRGVETVINFDAPKDISVYLHRVGRTARAGRKGTAITLVADSDRKLVKAAVKAGKDQGTKTRSVTIDTALAKEWQDKVDDLEAEVDEILAEEKELKQLQQADMEIQKGENLIKHAAEIKSRPKRTWFETEHEKKKAKEGPPSKLSSLRESLKKKHANGKLSNKDMKKLDNKAERQNGRLWKKGAAERAGKGAVLNLRKNGKGEGKSSSSKVKARPAFEAAEAGPKPAKGKGRGRT